MKKTALTLIVASFVATTAALAQYTEAPNGLTWRWVWNNFQYPITDNYDRNDFTTGAEIMYVRHLGKGVNLAIPLKLGKADLPLDGNGNVRDGEFISSLDLALQIKLFKEPRFIYPYLMGGAGLMVEWDNDRKLNPEFPIGLGLNFRLGQHLYASVETQYRTDLNNHRNQLQHAAGFWLILGGGIDEPPPVTDADKDGIPDVEDQCPNEPGTPALFGCPDSDGDGIANKLDDCPNEAGLANLRGCPDRDNDSVPDHQDACPDQAGLASNKGCPDTDRDGDGVPNDTDKCPDEKGSAFTGGCPDDDSDGVANSVDKCPTVAGLPAYKGCPDTDGDGIADPEDKCPKTAGPAFNQGCPELKKEEKEKLEFAMRAVQFETGSAKLLATSNKVLDEIAAIFLRYPEQKLRISGHTDSIGDDKANQQLSERRAKACFDYLVGKGISGSNMTHAGYGESKPIGDNRFAPGREQNRRVEFEVVVD